MYISTLDYTKQLLPKKGFGNWVNANVKDKGLGKHTRSSGHQHDKMERIYKHIGVGVGAVGLALAGPLLGKDHKGLRENDIAKFLVQLMVYMFLAGPLFESVLRQ